jgi:hypothetical protein
VEVSVINEIRGWFRPLARAGYAARGLIYIVIGFFAALAAIGSGEAMGSKDALMVLLSSGAGSALAYALIAGLAFYALWRLIQAGFDTDNHGREAKGLAIRSGLLVSGIVYATLASYSWSLASGGGGGDNGEGWAEMLASFVGARWVAAGLAVAPPATLRMARSACPRRLMPARAPAWTAVAAVSAQPGRSTKRPA